MFYQLLPEHQNNVFESETKETESKTEPINDKYSSMWVWNMFFLLLLRFVSYNFKLIDKKHKGKLFRSQYMNIQKDYHDWTSNMKLDNAKHPTNKLENFRNQQEKMFKLLRVKFYCQLRKCFLKSQRKAAEYQHRYEWASHTDRYSVIHLNFRFIASI
jgi:hypothetical protein